MRIYFIQVKSELSVQTAQTIFLIDKHHKTLNQNLLPSQNSLNFPQGVLKQCFFGTRGQRMFLTLSFSSILLKTKFVCSAGTPPVGRSCVFRHVGQ